MVKAGDPVDELIVSLVPLLERGDIIIDGGNSHFPDTNVVVRYLKNKGIFFIGAGISGGEEGADMALHHARRPSRSMASCKRIFQGIAAKVRKRGALLRLGRR